VSGQDAVWRPLGFLLLVLGLGLRLDTPFQGIAWAFIAAGAGSGGVGLWLLGRRRTSGGAFVRRGDGE
jgi:hypothetical protein